MLQRKPIGENLSRGPNLEMQSSALFRKDRVDDAPTFNNRQDQFSSLRQDHSIHEDGDLEDDEENELSVKSEDEEERIKLLSEHPLLSIVKPDRMPIFDRNQLLEKYMKLDGLSSKDTGNFLKWYRLIALEHRLLEQEEGNWFNEHGALVLDSEIFEEKNRRYVDIGIEKNLAFSTWKRNAIVSDRINQRKLQSFRLDLSIGKLKMFRYSPYLSIEETVANDLFLLTKIYNQRVDMAMIPYLSSSIDMLYQEYIRLSNSYKPPEKELDLISYEMNRRKGILQKETDFLQNLANSIDDKWETLKRTRLNQNFSSSPIRLQKRKYISESDSAEVELICSQEKISLYQDFQNKPLPRSELRRRNLLQKLRVFVRIIINGRYVARTKKSFIEWPSLEINFLEKFQIFLYSRPSSIKLQLVVGFRRFITLQTIEVPIPGDIAQTLTSANAIYRELTFCKKAKNEKSKLKKERKTKTKSKSELNDELEKERERILQEEGEKQQNNDDSGNPILLNETERKKKKKMEKKERKELNKKLKLDQKEKIEKEKRKLEKRLKKKNLESNTTKTNTDFDVPVFSDDILARLSFKAEWPGLGPKLPPKSFSKNELSEKTAKITEDKYFDPNDPRNEELIDYLINFRAKQLQDTNNVKDFTIPLADVISLRQKLLKWRLINPDLYKYKIPLKDEDIFENRILMKILKETSQDILDADDEIGFDHEDRPFYLKDLGEVVQYPQSRETVELIIQLKRILKFCFLIKSSKRQRTVKLSKSITSGEGFYTVRSVVDEFLFEEAANPIIEFLKSFFTQKRKLGYKRAITKKITPTNIPKIDFNIHIVKGVNIPIRSSVAPIISQLRQKRSNNASVNYPAMPQMNMNQYGGQPNAGIGMGGQYNNYGNQYGRGPNMGGTPISAILQDENTRMILRSAQLDDITNLQRVYSYVEIKLIEENGRTQVIKGDCIEGVFPEWNDSKTLSLVPSDQNSVYVKMKDVINTKNKLQFTLFDAIGDIRQRSDNPDNYSLTVQRHYLGSITLPVINLLTSQKIEANFKLNRPLILLGYFSQKFKLFSSKKDSDNIMIQVTDPSIPTYLRINLSIEPQIDIPTEYENLYNPGFEDAEFLLDASIWLEKLKKKKKKIGKRYIKLWGENIEGKSVFLPRFLTPMKPPFSLDDPHIYEKCARFVSLIPFKYDWEHFNDVPDLWCTSEEFIALRGGDYEEHATLLCNYFNFIDSYKAKSHIKSYIVFGKANPEGRTIYVIRRDTRNNEFEIWNPCNGDPYFFKSKNFVTYICCFKISKGVAVESEYDEIICPLFEIGCIVNEENVWVNIQKTNEITETSFDIENKKYWKPFLKLIS